MIITIHVEPNGVTHFVDTDPTHQGAVFQDPAGGAAKLTILQLLAALSANPAFRTQGGWDRITGLDGPFLGMSLWQVMVSQANAVTADPAVKALGLK